MKKTKKEEPPQREQSAPWITHREFLGGRVTTISRVIYGTKEPRLPK